MRQRGMTLVELLVVVVVASIVGIAMLNLFVTSNRTFMDQNKVLDAQRDGRLVMEFISRSLREAGLKPVRDPDLNVGIEEATPTKIRITRDANFNGGVDAGTLERLTLVFDGGRRILQRCTDEGTPGEVCVDMVKNVDNFALTYEDAAGGALAPDPTWTFDDLRAIRLIKVTLTFSDTRTLDQHDFLRSYTTDILLRNF